MKILLISYDNGSYIHFFPQGIAYLAAVLRKEGHDVSIYNQDIYHHSEIALTHWLNSNRYDLVGLGFCAGYYQYRKGMAISEAVNQSKNRSKLVYVLGGHGPSAEPEFFREKMGADVVVMGDGEDAILHLAEGKGWGADCRIVGYREKIDSIPFPAYDLFPMNVYRLIRFPHTERNEFAFPILTGRGCKWACTFCYRMEKGFRPRSPEAVIDEMKLLNREWGISHFQFSDELFMSDEDRIHTFCRALERAFEGRQLPDGRILKWDCNGRLNFAERPALVAMKRIGCTYINYGIEALDDSVLEKMNKHLSVGQIYAGIEATIAVGITPGLNIMWGSIGDTEETLQRAVNFLLRYDSFAEFRTIRPVTPYPGSVLYQYAIDQGLLEGPEDFYEWKHRNSDLLTVNFTELPDDIFHRALYNSNVNLSVAYYSRVMAKVRADCQSLYVDGDASFRGFRDV